jgi:sulfur carrier protein
MTVFVNDSEVKLEEPSTLLHILGSLSIKTFEGIAIALNNEVIPKSELEKIIVKENDKVLIIRAFQGG